jgi:hypothetical protein
MRDGEFLEGCDEGGHGTGKAAQQEFIQRAFMNAMSSGMLPRAAQTRPIGRLAGDRFREAGYRPQADAGIVPGATVARNWQLDRLRYCIITRQLTIYLGGTAPGLPWPPDNPKRLYRVLVA